MSGKGIIISIIVLIILGGAFYWAVQQGYITLPGTEGESQWKSLENPLQGLEPTNPFEKLINPFKELYKNPFKK